MNRRKERHDIIHELPLTCIFKREDIPKNITYNVEYYGPKNKMRDFFRIDYCNDCIKENKKIKKICSSKSMKKYTINEKLLTCIDMLIQHLYLHIQTPIVKKKIENYQEMKRKLIIKIKDELNKNK